MTLFEQLFQLQPNLLIGQCRRPVTPLGKTTSYVSSIDLKAKFLAATTQFRATTLALASTAFALA
ncbi:hypothetical protein AMTRI_Chr10g225110 [Amborella trichopoda]